MTKKPHKPILCLDFDGVIHSYTSGWQGARCIPDRPVRGALRFIWGAMSKFDVQIFSSRSRYIGGRRAMRRWLVEYYCALAPCWKDTPEWLRDPIAKHSFADPFSVHARYCIKNFVGKIGFPKHKPPAMVTLDDRALTFTGDWPSLDDLAAFKPWYR